MIGHVEATFVRRNDGIATESMRVRFPVRRDQYEWAISDDFEATIAGERVAIAFAADDDRPLPDATAEASAANVCAAFPADFPPGVDVVVTVRYDVFPTGSPRFGAFGYGRDTGAAWAGTIGDVQGDAYASVSLRQPLAAARGRGYGRLTVGRTLSEPAGRGSFLESHHRVGWTDHRGPQYRRGPGGRGTPSLPRLGSRRGG